MITALENISSAMDAVPGNTQSAMIESDLSATGRPVEWCQSQSNHLIIFQTSAPQAHFSTNLQSCPGI